MKKLVWLLNIYSETGWKHLYLINKEVIINDPTLGQHNGTFGETLQKAEDKFRKAPWLISRSRALSSGGIFSQMTQSRELPVPLGSSATNTQYFSTH